MSGLYDTDFYAWAHEQARLLREGKIAAADIAHIVEELESLGRTEKRELVSRLTVLLTHLLEWAFQPNLRSRSWRLTIETQRDDVVDHLADNPSLKARLDELLAKAYRRARREAELETGLAESAFPVSCPWTFAQIVDPDFWPEG
jgi:hypothetical protein